MTDELYFNLVDKVSNELCKFRSKMLKKETPEVYDRFYEICFFENYAEMLMADYIQDKFLEFEAEWLVKKDDLLNFLFAEWLDDSVSALNLNWNTMTEWLRQTIKYHLRKERNEI